MSEFEQIAGRWQDVKDTAITDGGLLANCCVLASKVLLVALTEAGYDAWVEPTYTLAMNDEAQTCLGRPTSEWPESAWSVGVEPGNIDPGSYPGHLVVFCYVDNDLILLDGSASQFSRPAKQMTVPSVLAFAVPHWPDAASYSGSTWRLMYKPAPLGQLHRVANDWTKNWRKYTQQMKEIHA